VICPASGRYCSCDFIRRLCLPWQDQVRLDGIELPDPEEPPPVDTVGPILAMMPEERRAIAGDDRRQLVRKL
jgi:hypothetical protein